MAPGPTLDQTLAGAAAPDLGAAVLGICRAAVALAGQPDPGGAALAAALAPLPLRWLLGHPAERAAEIDPAAGLALAVCRLAEDHPGAPRGTLFTLRPAAAGPAGASFLTPPPAAIAAGCLLHGAQALLVLAIGDRAALYALDPGTGRFACLDPKLRIPGDAPILAADLGGYRHWDRPVRRFVDDCLAGTEGPHGRDFAQRWSGSLAAEAIAVLLRGGICLAPPGARPAPSLIHLGQPLARLAEAAGGRATDGHVRLLDRAPRAFGETRPLAFGSAAQIDRLAACHDLPDADASPLFGRRGLFRT